MLLQDFLAMSSPLRLATIATITGLLFAQPSLQQTYSKCDPLSQTCAPDPALGRSMTADFTSGPSSDFTNEGYPKFSSDGVALTVSQGGDAPTLVSNWYIMFGKVEIVMKAAPGTGIVSSVVLQSDDLDEIDWEWVGANNDQVQTNYFGKGDTTTYDRGGTSQVSDSQGSWHTYTVEWTEDQIVWSIDGNTARVLAAADADTNQYPQTPCQLKIGSWSAGDPSNAPGTIAWAGGPTDYSAGPFTMYVQSVSVVDYSTGTKYTYGDQSGDWTSIESTGGKVNGNAGGSFSDTPTPAEASTASGSVVPFLISGTPSATQTSYPGLPSGWSVDPTTGKVIPPSSAPSTLRSVLSTPSPAVSPAPHCSGGTKVVTTFNQRGFKEVKTVAVGAITTFDDKGLPVTVNPSGCQVNDFQEKVAEIMGVTQTNGVLVAEPTAQPSALPTDIGFYLQEKKSKGSTVTVHWFSTFGTFIAALLFTGLLA